MLDGERTLDMAEAAEGPVVRRRRSRRPAPELTGIDPAGTDPLEQQVYRSIREALIGGRVAAGAGLSVRSLAETLGVSAAPVRDALKRLEADGVLFARARSGFSTRPLDVAEYGDLLDVRLRLEPHAAALAAQRASPQDLAEITAAHDGYVRALAEGAQGTSVAAHNQRFHFAIYRAARNPVLLDLISNLWVRLGPVLARVTADLIPGGHDHHRLALMAIREGRSDMAAQAIRDDLAGAARSISATIAALQAADATA